MRSTSPGYAIGYLDNVGADSIIITIEGVPDHHRAAHTTAKLREELG